MKWLQNSQSKDHQPNLSITIVISLCGLSCWGTKHIWNTCALITLQDKGSLIRSNVRRKGTKKENMPIGWDSQMKICSMSLPPSLPHTSILGNLFPFFQNSKVSSTNSYEFYTTFIFKLLCASHSTLGPIYFIGKIKPCDIWWRYPKIILLNEHKYIFSFLFHMMAAFEEAKCIIQRRMAESCSPGGHIHIHPIFKSTQKQRN